VTIFTIWFESFPLNFAILLISLGVAGVFVYTFLKAALVAEGGRPGWTRSITGPNGKLLFTALLIAWAVVFFVGLNMVPQEGANTPYGGLGLIAMFSGFFITMGLIWSVVGE
jgi:hypothetical protein